MEHTEKMNEIYKMQEINEKKNYGNYECNKTRKWKKKFDEKIKKAQIISKISNEKYEEIKIQKEEIEKKINETEIEIEIQQKIEKSKKNWKN